MADRVRYNLDKSALFFKELEVSSLFSKDEVRAIVKKVTDYEYTVVRAELETSEYLDYLSYQINLDKLFNVRYKKLLAKHDNFLPKADYDTIKSMQKSLLKQINYTFERACRRFPQEESLYESHISFLREKQSNNLLDMLFGRILSLFPKNAKFWIQASTHELHANNNLHAARVIMQRAIRSMGENAGLWKHMFDLELYNILRTVERKKVLGLINDSGDIVDTSGDKAELEREISQLQAPLIVVFRHACTSLLSPDAVQSFLKNENADGLPVGFSNLWCLMEMMLSAVTLNSTLSAELKKIFEDTLVDSQANPEENQFQQYLYFHKFLEKLHFHCAQVLMKVASAGNIADDFETIRFILHTVTALFEELSKFRTLSNNNENEAVVRNLLPFAVSLTKELSVYLFSQVTNGQETKDNMLRDLGSVYLSTYEQITNGVLLYRSGLEENEEFCEFKRSATQSSLSPEIQAITTKCVQILKNIDASVDFESSGDVLNPAALSQLLLSRESLRSFIVGLDDDEKELTLWPHDNLWDYFKNLSTQAFKEARNPLVKEINQFAELLKSYHANDGSDSLAIKQKVIGNVLTSLAFFAFGSNSNEYLASAFFPYISLNRKKLQDLPLPAWVTEPKDSVDIFDSIVRSFLLSNVDGSGINNNYQGRYLLVYLQISLNYYRETGSSLVEVKDVISWVLSYMKKYSLLLLPASSNSIEQKLSMTENLKWEIYTLLWDILGSVSDNDETKFDLQDYKKTFLQEIFVKRNEMTVAIEDSNLRNRRERLVEEFSKYCREDGRHDLANHIQFKKRRFC